jgi:cell division protein FtsN
VRVLRNGETWYRVQVGRFANAEQASDMMRRLREREHVNVFMGSE